jgi:hypothetical protein
MSNTVTFSGSGELTQSKVNSDIGSATIVIIEGYTRIASYAFSSKTNIISVTIPVSVTTIGSFAFRSCTGLTLVTIPNSVTTIETSAFRSCTGLTSVTIGNSVTTIGSFAFRSCSSLISIIVDVNNISYSSIGDVLFNKSETILITFPRGKSGAYTIPNSVTTIGAYAFRSCTGLTLVTIPNSVTTIELSVFESCIGLTSVTIGNSVTTIGSFAFNNCPGLTLVTIPNSVTTIEMYAFNGCIGLTSVTIGNSVTTIGTSAFYACKGLNLVTIPISVTSIGYNAFSSSGVTKVTISNSQLGIISPSHSVVFFGKNVRTYLPANRVFSIPTQTFGNDPFTIPPPISNSDGSFTYTSSNSLVSISGSTITIVGIGTAIITATQAETANYASGTITAELVVKTSPALSVFSFPPQTFGNAPFTIPPPISNSDGSFTYTSSNSLVSISGSMITINGAGTTIITATQAETANYASEEIIAELVVNKASPDLTNFSIPTKFYGDSPFTITAPISNSDGSFTYASSDPNIATIYGNTIEIYGIGRVNITATQLESKYFTSDTITSSFIVTTIPGICPVPIIKTNRYVCSLPNTLTGDAKILKLSNTLSASTMNDEASLYSSLIKPSGRRLTCKTIAFENKTLNAFKRWEGAPGGGGVRITNKF